METTLNAAQIEWLTKHGLEMSTDAHGTIDVRPKGVRVWDRTFYSIRQWDGKGKWEVMFSYVDGKFGTWDPCARVVAKHATLRTALADLVERERGERAA